MFRSGPDPGAPLAPSVARLAEFVVGGDPSHRMAGDLASWMVRSTRFRTFVEVYRDKIRKKVRGAADPEALADVAVELRIARLLLTDRRVTIAFESYGAGHVGPDFSVTFRGGRTFNVEVTRLRHLLSDAGIAVPILAKLRQLPPGTPNVLVVAVAEPSALDVDIPGSVRDLRHRADRKDDPFFTSRGFAGTRGFYDRFLRLGAVLAWSANAEGDDRVAGWTNASARIALSPGAVEACLRCLRSSE